MNSLKAKEKNNKIGELINNILMLSLWMLFGYCLVHVTVSLSNVPKYFYFYLGASAFIGIILLIRKTNLFKWYIIIPIVAFWGNVLFFYYIHRHEYGYQYIAMLMAKYLMFVLFAIVVVDLIKKGLKNSLNKKHIGLFIVFCIAIVVTVVLGHDYILPVICPICALYFTAIDSATWKKMMFQFSISMYIVTYLYTLASFILKPNAYVGGRYWGIFNFPVAGAILGALGFISGVYMWISYFHKINKLVARVFILGLFIVYPTFVLLITLDRAVIFGLLSIFVFSCIFCFGKEINCRKRSIIAISVMLILLILFSASAVAIYNIDDQLFNIISAKVNESFPGLIKSAYYFASRFKTGSKYSYFEQGTLMNAVDYFTSYRLGLWYLASKEIRLLGGSPITFVIRDIEYHTHNTYVEWFLKVGWIGGISLTAWILYYLVVSIKLRIKKDSLSLWSFWWITFCLVFMIVERELWIELPIMLLLIFQYPFLFNIVEKEN